ncbi:MAG TPA: hypothetical protein VF474_05220 [Phenylobacterium sp.]
MQGDFPPRQGALAGLADGEAGTIPSMAKLEPWDVLETARRQFMAASIVGRVAPRYKVAATTA